MAESGGLWLTPAQVRSLRGLVRQWHVAADQPGNGASIAVLDIACEVRTILGMDPTP